MGDENDFMNRKIKDLSKFVYFKLINKKVEIPFLRNTNSGESKSYSLIKEDQYERDLHHIKRMFMPCSKKNSMRRRIPYTIRDWKH
jgi:hypothetical protein